MHILTIFIAFAVSDLKITFKLEKLHTKSHKLAS